MKGNNDCIAEVVYVHFALRLRVSTSNTLNEMCFKPMVTDMYFANIVLVPLNLVLSLSSPPRVFCLLVYCSLHFMIFKLYNVNSVFKIPLGNSTLRHIEKKCLKKEK